MYLIISTSLNPSSRSRIVATECARRMEPMGVDFEMIDLRDCSLPWCDAESCYADPKVVDITSKIETAQGVLLATPIYNYNCCSSAKNLIELTGQAWSSKVVAFACAAGGNSSYMSIMGIANSLMLDFRSMIVPRFVYVTGEHFEGARLTDEDALRRVEELVREWVRVGDCLSQPG